MIFVNTCPVERSPAVAVCYAQHVCCMNAMDLIGTHRLFDLVTVIPCSFSELKWETCGNLCECTPIQGNWKNLKLIDYMVSNEFYIHCPEVEIYAVRSFDAVGRNQSQIHLQHFTYKIAHLYINSSLLSVALWKPLEKQLGLSGFGLVPVAQNLIDVVWDDQPPPPTSPLMTLSLKYTGKLHQ